MGVKAPCRPAESRGSSCGIEREAHDPAAVVDVVGEGCVPPGASIVVKAPVQQEPVGLPLGIDVLADDLAKVIDAEGLGPHGAGDIDLREDAFVEQEPVGQLERGRVGVVAVGADDLSLRVDPRDEGGRGAGEIDHGEAPLCPSGNHGVFLGHRRSRPRFGRCRRCRRPRCTSRRAGHRWW